jgi:Fur family transcriptional regulator, iron response regulator
MDTLLAISLQERLRGAGIVPTLQRIAVAAVLLPKRVHMTAEQVLQAAQSHLPGISRATVYSVMQLFVRRGLLRELPIDGAATVFDSNVAPHHHIYNVDTGEVTDLPEGQLQILGVPQLSDDVELSEVDIIVRVRSRRGESAALAATA